HSAARDEALPLPRDGAKVVAVLGAVGPDKGARRLERLVDLVRARGSRLRFVLIGYLDRQHGPWQSADKLFTVHGRYHPESLRRLLREYGVDLVLYPSVGPETFSYTLSESWSAGQAVLVPPIGALAERVQASGAGLLLTDAEWRDDDAMLARIESLLLGGATAQRDAAAQRALAAPQRSPEAMAQATLALYDVAEAGQCPIASPSHEFDAMQTSVPRKATWPPLDRARVRDALGYTPWRPPPPSAEVLAARRSLRTRVARAAMRMRHTRFGATLYRRIPPRLLDALKSRLR
ncbi:MAG TPA: glycosyltransferase, partial [Casimicrobiaceae bacterium]